MKVTLASLLLLASSMSVAAPCFYNEPNSLKRFVCMGGARLTHTPQGMVWYATRGCFVSRRPCCYHNASHYGHYASAHRARLGYHRCKRNYPYRWGDFPS